MPITPNTADRLLASLAAHPGSTVAELSELAGLGRSTVGKCLAALEAGGRATRTPGERDGARRPSGSVRRFPGRHAVFEREHPDPPGVGLGPSPSLKRPSRPAPR